MKLLQITASGLPLFRSDFRMTFYALQRVGDFDKEFLYPLGKNGKFYLNCANAIIGINASGKTSALKVILLALDILNNQPINHSDTKEILGEAKEVVFVMDFLTNKNEACRLETHIASIPTASGISYQITNETLWTKPLSKATTKQSLVDFSRFKPYATRNSKEAYLPDDISIMIAFNKKNDEKTTVANQLFFTNVNFLPYSKSIPSEVIRFLDPTVEYLRFNKEGQKLSIHLKFVQGKELVLSHPVELNSYLSSGTVKGIVVFMMAIETLKSGGYLVIDELENHFNKEIAATLIRFFMDSSLNKSGGSLIFTSHYPELLDEFDRNDCIHITTNRDGMEIKNLKDVLKRNDLKKSDAYQSGILDGTIPSYESYINLRRIIQNSMASGD